MARIASEFNKQRLLLDDCLDKLRKYGQDIEWKSLPDYSNRVAKNMEGAKAAFGNLMQMLMPKADKLKT